MRPSTCEIQETPASIEPSSVCAMIGSNQDGTTAKSTSLAVPPMPWNGFCAKTHAALRAYVQETMLSIAMDFGPLLHQPTAGAVQIQPNHDEISMEYLLRVMLFPALEMVPIVDRHHALRLQRRAIGTQFNWTLNQKIVFTEQLSLAPQGSCSSRNVCWKRCVRETKYDFASAVCPSWSGNLLSAIDGVQSLHLRSSNSENPWRKSQHGRCYPGDRA